MIGNFVWGDGGKAITPDDAKRRREIAMAMIQQGTANKPIQHWAQGAANVAQALMGAYDMRQTDKQEAAAREASKASEAQFLGMLGGSGSTAPASSVAAPSVGGANPNEVSNQFLDAVKANGIQNPVALAAIGATGERESGWSPKRINATWADPSESGQAGTSGGLMSWRAERLDNLRKFAAANGETGLGSPQTQARFFVSESPQLVQRLNTAKTPQEAMLAMNDAWRFAGYNRPGGERDARLSAAEAWAARMGRAPNIASTPEMAGPIGNAPEMPADSTMAQPMPDRPMTVSPAAVASPAPVAPNPATQQVAQANPQLLQAAMARMNDPYASPGSRAVAQALVQRLVTQETKDPMAQEKLRLEVEDMRKRSGRVEMETKTAADGTVFEREKGRPGAQWQQSIKLPSKPEERTSDQRELDQVNAERKAGGLQPLRLDEYKIQKARAGAASVNIDTGSKADEKFSEAFAKGDSEALQTIATAGMAARRNISRIDRLETLINQNPTGGLSALQQRAGEFGINTKGLDGIQAAQALINSLVPEQRQPGSGPMSDADLALFKESLPRIINQPDGNRRIIDTMRGIAKYDAEGAAIVQQLRENKINRAQAFEMLQNRANPLAEFSQPPVSTAPGNLAPSTPEPGKVLRYNPQTGEFE